MFTNVTTRKMNRERAQETLERARSEFFPKLQNAPGFVGFYLVTDEENGINTAISVWQDAASARAFMPEVEKWQRVLEEMGHVTQTTTRGETVVSLQRQ